MQIGCPTEVKAQEFRVGLTPNAAREAVAQGHDVLIQSGAGLGAGFLSSLDRLKGDWNAEKSFYPTNKDILKGQDAININYT